MSSRKKEVTKTVMQILEKIRLQEQSKGILIHPAYSVIANQNT